MQYKSYQKVMQQQASPQYISYPGLDLGSNAGSGAAMQISANDQMIMDVLFARNSMMLEGAHRV